MTKYFYKNCQRESDHDKTLEKSAECTSEIFQDKRSLFFKWQTNLKILILHQKLIGLYQNVYSTIKKIPTMPPLIVDGKFISDFFRESKPF